MILLDTNVISALMSEVADTAVDFWLDAQPVESLWTTAITVLELRYGIERLVPSRRRRQLEQAFTTAIDELLGGRVIPFDRTAAENAAKFVAERERGGRPTDIRDIQIAGTAAARRATLVTRNTRHFDGLGIALVNPWAEP